jgi:hypothetical protein
VSVCVCVYVVVVVVSVSCCRGERFRALIVVYANARTIGVTVTPSVCRVKYAATVETDSRDQVRHSK